MDNSGSTSKDVPVKDYRSNSLWRLTMRRLFQQKSAIIGYDPIRFTDFQCSIRAFDSTL